MFIFFFQTYSDKNILDYINNGLKYKAASSLIYIPVA